MFLYTDQNETQKAKFQICEGTPLLKRGAMSYQMVVAGKSRKWRTAEHRTKNDRFIRPGNGEVKRPGSEPAACTDTENWAYVPIKSDWYEMHEISKN